MKKLYTILATAAIAISATAAQFTPDVQEMQVLDIKEAPKGAKPVLTLKEEAKHMAQAPAKITIPLEDFSGDYTLYCLYGGEPDYSPYSVEKVDNSNSILKNFIFGSRAMDVPATVVHDATYNMDFFTIQPGTPLTTSGTNTCVMYLYAKYTDGKYYYFTGDTMEFFKDAAGNMIYAYEDAGFLVGFKNEADGKFYSFPAILDPTGFKANSTLTATEVIGNDEDNQPIFGPVDNKFYAEYNAEQEKLLMLGFSDCSQPVVLDVNKEARTVSGTNVFAVKLTTNQGTAYDFYLDNNEDENATDYVFTAQIESVEAEKSTLYVPYYLIYNFDLGWYRYVLDASIELPFALYETDAIANVSAALVDGPAEYFNLQGQRVTNPKAGELVIKRQGNNVVKTIVR